MSKNEDPDTCNHCGQYVGFSYAIHVHLVHPEHCEYIPPPTAKPQKKGKNT